MLKNITLSAEKSLIQKAREKAVKERKSFNVVFREWLRSYTGQKIAAENYKDLMKQLRHIHPGRKFSRVEMNER